MMLPLTTPRLLLRRFRDREDLPSFSHYRNLPEVARFPELDPLRHDRGDGLL
ncbi:hypothetical protein LNP74_31905 [Klebsiella pneumoniae subsp. pneumoniae]|nr:hypothetical protein [Klebsiella pneumoniae subsp. pneumoniae]